MSASTKPFENGAHAGRVRRLREACSDAGLLPPVESLLEYTRSLDWEQERDGALTVQAYQVWEVAR